MTHFGKAAMFGAAFALLATGCARKAGPDVVLVVDGRYEFRADHFRDYLFFNTHPDVVGEKWGEGVKDMLFKRYVEEQVLLVAAWEQMDSASKKKAQWSEPADIPFPSTPALKEQFLQEQILAKLKVEESEMRAHYEAQREDFRSVERAIVRYMRLPDKESLANTSRSLSNGEASFAELSVRYATTPAEAETHAFERDTLTEEMEKAIFSLRPGEISAPVPMKDEFYLFELVRMEPAQQMDFETAKPAVEKHLLEQKAAAQMEALIRKKSEDYKVETYPEHIGYRSPKGRLKS